MSSKLLMFYEMLFVRSERFVGERTNLVLDIAFVFSVEHTSRHHNSEGGGRVKFF